MEQPVTLERFDGAEIVAVMTEAEALRAESDIISTGNRLRGLLVEFYERRGWAALGYGSWRAWASERLGQAERTAYQELTAGLVERELLRNCANEDIAPIPESHLRPLAPLRNDPDLMRDAWDDAHAIAEQRGEPFKAAHVTEAVNAIRAPEPAIVRTAEDYADFYGDDEPEPEPAVPMAVHFSSASAEWYTPGRILDRARRVLGVIDLDPASSQEAQRTVQAVEWFGLDHPQYERRDGLARDWHGHVWMNPPYGDVIGDWVHRLIHQYPHFTYEALALLPARTDTAWFKPLKRRFACCFIDGRLKFSNADNSAPFPSVVVYLAPVERWPAFVEAFGDIGDVLVPFDA